MSSTGHDPVGVAVADARVQEVSDGVFAYIQPDGSWWINNTGFLVGARGVIAVDSCSTERRTRAFRDAVSAVSAAPVRTLVNTHHHGDHTNGNSLFPEATIVGHELVRQAMNAWGPPGPLPFWEPVEWGEVELAPPFLTYTDQVALYVDDLRCDLRFVGGPAHTTNDSILWVPERKVLFAGDLLFNGGTPFLLMGSVAGELAALRVLRDLGPETIVPGHGEVCGIEVIDVIERYVRFVQATARDAHAAGLSPLDAARDTDLGEFAGLLDAERIVGNLYRAYHELDGGEPGAPLDFAAALTDMVAYNGGRPLSCYA